MTQKFLLLNKTWLFVCLSLFAFIACSDKDDSTLQDDTVTEQSIVGQWNVVRIKGARYYNAELDEEYDEKLNAPYDRVVFFQNGIGEYWEYDSDGDHKGEERYREDSKGLQYHEDGQFVFTQDGTKFAIKSDDFICNVVDYDGANKMTLYITSSEEKGASIVYEKNYLYLERVQ